MKYIAVFLVLNVLLLSSVTGMANISHVTASCCATKMKKDCCKQQKHSSDNDCAKGTCNAMMSCGTCGFIVVSSVSLSPPIIHLISNQNAPHFITGELSDYQDNDWNPPKA
jgi:hypothetical protein